jgi:hypothetical protein
MILNPHDFGSRIPESGETISIDTTALNDIEEQILYGETLEDFKRVWDALGKIKRVYTVAFNMKTEDVHSSSTVEQKTVFEWASPSPNAFVASISDSGSLSRVQGLEDFSSSLRSLSTEQSVESPDRELPVKLLNWHNYSWKTSQFSWSCPLPEELKQIVTREPLLAMKKDSLYLVISLPFARQAVHPRAEFLRDLSGFECLSAATSTTDFKIAFPGLGALGDSYDNVPFKDLIKILDMNRRQPTSQIQVVGITIPQQLVVLFGVPGLTVLLLQLGALCEFLATQSSFISDSIASRWSFLLQGLPFLSLGALALIGVPTIGLWATAFFLPVGTDSLFQGVAVLAFGWVFTILLHTKLSPWWYFVFFYLAIFYGAQIFILNAQGQHPNRELLLGSLIVVLCLASPLALLRRPGLILATAAALSALAYVTFRPSAVIAGVTAVSISSSLAFVQLTILRRRVNDQSPPILLSP